MTDILAILPDFDLEGFAHIVPSLEKAHITTADILSLDPFDTARRAGIPPAAANNLLEALRQALLVGTERDVDDATSHPGFGLTTGQQHIGKWRTISVLDESIDRILNGGVAVGHLTEVTGESAVGKTQCLLTLLLSVQLKPPLGSGKAALYISTESQLQTTRLKQILDEHPRLNQLAADEKPSLAKVQSTRIHDLEAQDHILRYQVPVAIERGNVGLLVIDSIAANYRAEFDKGSARKGTEALAKRAFQLAKLGALLRELASKYNIAVVVANQVADRFSAADEFSQQGALSQSTQLSQSRQPSQKPLQPDRGTATPMQLSTDLLSTGDPLALDHQQCFFTGWGDDPAAVNLKTPSLGLTWTNQLSARIVLLKEPIYDTQTAPIGTEKVVIGWKRTFKIVFSAWAADSGQEYEVWKGGIRALLANTSQKHDPAM